MHSLDCKFKYLWGVTMWKWSILSCWRPMCPEAGRGFLWRPRGWIRWGLRAVGPYVVLGRGGHQSNLVVRCWSSGVRQPVFLGKASISTSMKWESKTALIWHMVGSTWWVHEDKVPSLHANVPSVTLTVVFPRFPDRSKRLSYNPIFNAEMWYLKCNLLKKIK